MCSNSKKESSFPSTIVHVYICELSQETGLREVLDCASLPTVGKELLDDDTLLYTFFKYVLFYKMS